MGRATKRRDADEEMLNAIYSQPRADPPRAVYADALCERGEPLGEFIQLQLRRENDGARTKAAETRLLKAVLWEPNAWWAPPLLYGHDYKQLKLEQFRRGFPFAVSLDAENRRSRLRDLIGHPAWNMTEVLSIPFGRLAKAVQLTIERCGWDALRVLHTPAEHLEKLHHDAFSRCAEIEVGLYDTKLLRVLSSIARFRSATRVQISSFDRMPVRDFLRAIELPKSVLMLEAPYSTLEDCLEVMKGTPSHVEWCRAYNFNLRRGTSLPSLHVGVSADPKGIPYPNPDEIQARGSELEAVKLDLSFTPNHLRSRVEAQFRRTLKRLPVTFEPLPEIVR